ASVTSSSPSNNSTPCSKRRCSSPTGGSSTTPTVPTPPSGCSHRPSSLGSGGPTNPNSHNRWTDKRGPVSVADPFHIVRVANRCVDQVRRRVQNETLGHRGRKRDPLFRIRKLLLTGSERLDERGSERILLGLRVGDPH